MNNVFLAKAELRLVLNKIIPNLDRKYVSYFYLICNLTKFSSSFLNESKEQKTKK